MKVLYIGETKTHEQYQKGNVPSHWFYGAIEMEHGGHKVIWAQEGVGLFDDMKTDFPSSFCLFRRINVF